MVLTKRTVINGEKARIRIEKYVKGDTPAIMLDTYNKELGGWFPHVALTLNFPGALKKDEVALKMYDGVDAFMILYEKNLIDIPHAYLRCSFINKIPICKIKFKV